MQDINWLGLLQRHDFITAPIFREFGITEIIATNAEVVDGKYTGKVINTRVLPKGQISTFESMA